MRTLTALLVVGLILSLALPAFAGERNILKEGLLGAAAGGAGAAAGDGDVATGAAVGAGVNVLGGVLLDAAFSNDGKTTSRDEIAPVESATAQQWFTKGYQDGFKAGYAEGLKAAK